MHLSITSHNAKEHGSFSENVFRYLSKENQEQDKEEMFFTHNFDLTDINNLSLNITEKEAIKQIDENRGTQRLKESNFYMLNLSPSKAEIEHMEKIADQELERKGIIFEKIKDNPELVKAYDEEKDRLVKAQLKVYTEEVMNEYARSMDREIYANQDKLPDNEARNKMKPEIEQAYNQFLIEKGFDVPLKEQNNTINIEVINVSSFGKGAIVTVYNENTNCNIKVYLPNDKFTDLGEKKMSVDEQFYNEKIYEIEQAYERKKESISVGLVDEVKTNNDPFLDYDKNHIVVIEKEIDDNTKLKLYFNSGEYSLDRGICNVSQSLYNEKLNEAKIRHYTKVYSEEKQAIFDKYAKEKGFDFTKVKGQYANPDCVPKGKELRSFKSEVSIRFNKFLMDKGLIDKKEQTTIKDWNTVVQRDVEILATSEKAKLLRIDDDRLNKPMEVWVGKFAIKSETNDGKISIIKDFYENLVEQQLEIQNDVSIAFHDYSEMDQEKTFKNKNESIEVSFNHDGLKNPITFNIEKEQLSVENGQYTIAKEIFELKYNKQVIEQAKTEFKEEWEKIQSKVEAENDGVNNRKVENIANQELEKFLQDKNILNDPNNDKYIVKATEIESKNKSKMIEVDLGGEEKVRMWVHESAYNKIDDQTISFKNQEKADKLIENAITRDKEAKTLIEISHLEVKAKDIKPKDGQEADKLLTFKQEHKGLKNGIEISFKQSELTQKDSKWYVEKYKLNHRQQKAIEKGIKSEYGDIKNKIRDQVWKKNGYDITKRKVEGKDLLYFAKIEKDRTYKHTDKPVKINREIQKQIKEIKEKGGLFSERKIKQLEKKMVRDKETGEVIKEGMKKGGKNYHIHIVTSRHDKTSINPKDKVSMSPVANQRGGTLHNGKKVGFDRDSFFKKTESIFDKVTEYDRPITQMYAYNNMIKKMDAKAKGFVKGKVKHEIMKITGMQQAMKEINPVKQAKREIMPIPIGIPKGKLDLIIKVVRAIKSAVIDHGMSM